MATEIERKFLVIEDKLPFGDLLQGGNHIEQGYLPTESITKTRIRVYGQHAYITIKSSFNDMCNHEYEYDIPVDDATKMLDDLCGPTISKVRHEIFHEGNKFELDVFEGPNEGLLMCEVELNSEDEEISLPDWIGKEVTGDVRYYNTSLLLHPLPSGDKNESK